MKLRDAVSSFTDWSYPWTFVKHVREKLAGNPEELAKFEAMFAEASQSKHWRSADLILCCKIAHQETKKMFSDAEDETVAALVRAASYDWR